MVDDKVTQAKRVFDTICAALDDRKFNYVKNEDELAVEFTVSGEDLDMPMRIKPNMGVQSVILTSVIGLTVPEYRRTDVALAIIGINNLIPNGFFVFDTVGGEIVFKIATGYVECLLGKGQIQSMIDTACEVVETYNDRFLFLIKDMVSLRDFFKIDS